MSNFRIPYLVGNKLGRDHQYWPCVDRPITDEQELFIANLALLMQMAWRVREWTVSAGTASFDAAGSYTGGFPGVISGAWDEFIMTMKRVKDPPDLDDPRRDVENELDALGPSSDSPISVLDIHSNLVDKWKTLRNAGVLGSFEDEDALIRVDAGIFGGEMAYDPDRKIFAPAFAFNGLISSHGTHPAVKFFALSQAEFDDTNPMGDSSTLTIENPEGDDITIPIALVGEDVVYIAGSGSISDVTIRPTKWWKYRNSLGQDVYDEFSGERVNDPYA